MRWSLRLGKLFGIRILMHWTFFLILVYIGFIGINQGQTWPEILLTTLLVLTVFVCVVMHELGHALTARRFGVETRRIVLLPIGGVAQLERMPEEPQQELAVAIAGPLVNVGIAILLGIVMAFAPGFSYLEPELWLEMEGRKQFVLNLLFINVFLVVFNLIPAFPMDGGRMLRAVLARRMDYVDATKVAARVGQFFAIIFALVGIFYNWVLILIALFVYLGAQGEAQMVQNRFVLRGFRVRHGMLTRFTTLHPYTSLIEAARELLAGSDKDFLIVDQGQVLGILTRDKLVESLSDLEKETRVQEVMLRDFATVQPNDNLHKAVNVLKEKDLPILPVVENGELVGALSMDNISELFLVNKPLDVEERMLLDNS